MSQLVDRPKRPTDCPPATRITKSLLGYGVIAGPIYVTVSLAQALTRAGFDLRRHAWSVLANGDVGWIQITNLIVTGLMVIAAAVGLRRVLRPGVRGGRAPVLLAGYGAGMVAAGLFRADPVPGFPADAAVNVPTVTWHGMMHLMCAGIGFACLVAACFLVGRRFGADGQRTAAWVSRGTGVLFGLTFLVMAASGGATWANVTFSAMIVLVSGWISAVSIHFYGRAASAARAPTTPA
jgi:hypothetical protein